MSTGVRSRQPTTCSAVSNSKRERRGEGSPQQGNGAGNSGSARHVHDGVSVIAKRERPASDENGRDQQDGDQPQHPLREIIRPLHCILVVSRAPAPARSAGRTNRSYCAVHKRGRFSRLLRRQAERCPAQAAEISRKPAVRLTPGPRRSTNPPSPAARQRTSAANVSPKQDRWPIPSFKVGRLVPI